MSDGSKGWLPPRRRDGDESRAHRGERTLVASASGWIQESLVAWSEDDHKKVAALAPLAVEHLGKAVLWRTAPTLLVPLSRDAEQALLSLATRPDIDDPRLKTIGLSGVLERLILLLQDFPIDDKARKRMVAVRNGAMHLGSSAPSRDVLVDALAVCRTLLAAIERPESEFFGQHLRSAVVLLDEKRTEVGNRVAAKRAKAGRILAEIEERLGHRFEEWVSDKELEAEELSPADFGIDLWGIEEECPECRSRGRLFGRVEVDPEIQEYPPIDEATPAEAHVVSWTVEMFPQAFECCVCQLAFHSPEELAEARLPSGRHEITADELGYDFDPEHYAQNRYTKWD